MQLQCMFGPATLRLMSSSQIRNPKMQISQKILQFLHYPVISSNLNLNFLKLIYFNRPFSSSRRAPKTPKFTDQQNLLYQRVGKESRKVERVYGFANGCSVWGELTYHVFKMWMPQCCKHSSRLPCISLQRISCNFPGSRSNLGLCLLLALLFSCGKPLFATST